MVGASASPPASRGGTPGLHTAPLTAPRPAGTSIATCPQDPAKHSATFWFTDPLAYSFLCSAARTPDHAAAPLDIDKRRDYYAVHACPVYAFRAMSIETLERISPSVRQFLCEAIHAAFPHPGPQSDACFANACRQLSVVQCRGLFRMLTAAGVHFARGGSGCICCAQQASEEVPH
jgi:hypothetical protein